jgi:hypothetical protein
MDAFCMEISKRIAAEIGYHPQKAGQDFAWFQLFALLAIVGTALATAVAALEGVPRRWRVLVAAVPTLSVAILSTFNFEARASWHATKAYLLDELHMRLESGRVPCDAAHAEWRDIEARFPGRRPTVGLGPLHLPGESARKTIVNAPPAAPVSAVPTGDPK